MLWVISLVLAIGVAGAWTLFDQSGSAKLPTETAQDMTTTQELKKAQNQVSTYYYSAKGMLPTEAVLSSSLGPDITYRTISQSMYELCGNFDSDSVSPMWQKGSSKSRGVYQKVVEGSALDEGDAIGIFRFHSSNQQRYKLTLNLPAS